MAPRKPIIYGQPLMSDVFNSAQVLTNGRKFKGKQIVCSRCGRTEVLHVNNFRGNRDGKEFKEDRFAARKFEEMGWQVDLKKGRHLCPVCIDKQTDLREQKRREDHMSQTVVPLPRTMGREDRRIVFEKLNEVYVDEKVGYQAPWTDEKVATDLGVPRAWVSSIREEMFGPVASNSDIDAAVKSASALIAEMTKLREQFEKLAAATGSMQKQLDQITKAVRP